MVQNTGVRVNIAWAWFCSQNTRTAGGEIIKSCHLSRGLDVYPLP